MRMTERPEWGELATFVPNKSLPVHNWFYYKEGFSYDLVARLAESFGLGIGDTVLDPFCGSGTTLLACRELGIDSIGFDVNPVAIFASRVKTREYDASMLREAGRALLNRKFQKPFGDVPGAFVRKAFNPHTLDDVLFFRDSIMAMEDAVIRDFLILALMNVAMKCSYAWKDGAVIKIRKHPVPPLRDMLRRQVFRMIGDVERMKKARAKCTAEAGDARMLKLGNGAIDAVITSPPYLNKIEYTKIYSIEEELFFLKKDITGLRSFVGTEDEKIASERCRFADVMDDAGLPLAAKAYFNDMHQVISELARVCRKGAMVGMVVGNGCFDDRVIDSDIILSRIAEKLGFEAKEILILNKRWCTRNRVEKVGVTRESLLVWEKR